jgi:hypothetical protein
MIGQLWTSRYCVYVRAVLCCCCVLRFRAWVNVLALASVAVCGDVHVASAARSGTQAVGDRNGKTRDGRTCNREPGWQVRAVFGAHDAV